MDNFGGEGTGLKTMMDVDWSPGEIVTFTVTGVQDGEAWICSCYFTHQGLNHFLASYRRTGPRPLTRNGFYSFVEVSTQANLHIVDQSRLNLRIGTGREEQRDI